jgi:hypothetical protein
LYWLLVLIALLAFTVAFSFISAKSRLRTIRSRRHRPDYWSKYDSELAELILKLIASDIGCEADQLYPNDSIRWLTFDDALTDNSGTEELMQDISNRLGEKLYWNPEWHTLSDLVVGSIEQFKTNANNQE